MPEPTHEPKQDPRTFHERFGYALEAEQWTSDEWKHHQQEMRDEPFLAPDDHLFISIQTAFLEIRRQQNAHAVDERSEKAPYVRVPTRSIVRTPSQRGWQHSYHSPRYRETSARGENAVIEIARGIAHGIAEKQQKHQTPQSVDHFLQGRFFDKTYFPVIAQRIDGPRGPLYLIQDGSHRVAAAKLVHLDTVFARVGSLTDGAEAKRVWYEALALMPEKARQELLRVYDRVYPPTENDHKIERSEFELARTYLGEVYDDIAVHQEKMERVAEEASRKAQEIHQQYEMAEYVQSRVAHRTRFNELRNKVALDFLRTHAPAHLWQEYEQRYDKNGFIVRRDGKESMIHVTGYDTHDSYRQILIGAVRAYEQEFPDEVKIVREEYSRSFT